MTGGEVGYELSASNDFLKVPRVNQKMSTSGVPAMYVGIILFKGDVQLIFFLSRRKKKRDFFLNDRIGA